MSLTEPRRTLIIFSLAHVFIFACVFSIPALAFYYDPGALERFLALKMLDGQIPYHDFPSEYPPLALVVFLLPAIGEALIQYLLPVLAAHAQLVYNIFLFAELLICDLLIIALLPKLAARFGIPLRETLVIYTVLLLAVGPLVIIRFDLPAALLVTVSLVVFLEGRSKTAWFALALGVATKLYPAVVAPLFVIYHLAKRQYRKMITGMVCFGAGLVVLFVPWLLIDVVGFTSSFGYHIGRGLHSESVYGTTLLLGKLLGLVTVKGQLSSGSWNLVSPVADTLAGMSFYVTIGLLLLAYGWFAGLLLRKSDREAASMDWRLLQFAFLVILVFIVTSKVLSAQYLIWLCPLLPLLVRKGRDYLWLLFVGAAAITQYIFPYGFFDFEQFKPYAVIMLAVRNFMMVALVVSIGLIIYRGKEIGLSQKPGGNL